MDRRLKLGLIADRKTRSTARRGIPTLVVISWVLSILACSQGYVSAVELTLNRGCESNGYSRSFRAYVYRLSRTYGAHSAGAGRFG